MAAHSSEIIPHFDFTEALRYDPDERMRLCVDRVRDRLSDEGLWDLLLIPPVPEMGASAGELRDLESILEVPLPTEYRAFRCAELIFVQIFA